MKASLPILTIGFIDVYPPGVTPDLWIVDASQVRGGIVAYFQVSLWLAEIKAYGRTS